MDTTGLDQLVPEHYVSREKLIKELEEFREFTYGPAWKPGKAAFTLAILVISGFFPSRKKR